MTAPRTAILSRLDQMVVLSSPLRQELLDVLARMGAVSLAEIGAVLGRPADGLYYHVRLLQQSGLVKSAGHRIRQGRKEALFRAAASEFVLRYASAPSTHARAVNSIVGAMLRLGLRDFRRALASRENRFEGPQRDLWALRITGWLLPAHVLRVNRLIRRLAKATSHIEPKGRLYGVTVLLTPLDHRANKTGRRTRGSAR